MSTDKTDDRGAYIHLRKPAASSDQPRTENAQAACYGTTLSYKETRERMELFDRPEGPNYSHRPAADNG